MAFALHVSSTDLILCPVCNGSVCGRLYVRCGHIFSQTLRYGFIYRRLWIMRAVSPKNPRGNKHIFFQPLNRMA